MNINALSQDTSSQPTSSRKDYYAYNKNFSLVDVLMIIVIVVCLAVLLIPVIQSFRESARRELCIHNLQTITEAALGHIHATQRFPTDGWGWKWAGDPDHGNERDQPGGWAYNILPFLDHQAVHDLGSKANKNQKRHATAQMVSTLLPEFICPSRRYAVLYPYHQASLQYFNSERTQLSSHTDYAINRGDFFMYAKEGPKSFSDASNFKWEDTINATGVSFLRSMVRMEDVTDGLSCTYLIGEKYLDPLNYTTGYDIGDDGSLYQGEDFDIARQTGMGYLKEKEIINSPLPPLRDMPGNYNCISFGSAHPTTWQASFCDGSVHSMSFDIDSEVHRKLGNRKDGEKLDTLKLLSE